VNLSAWAAEILRELADREPDRRVSWNIEPDLTVYADPQLMKSALRNLLSNAWKFTSRTADAQIRVHSQAEPSRKLICVSDNGAGFDPQHAYRLFRPFQQLHRADEFAGAGIGLTTIQRIIRRHGGIVDATASRGQGATFRFWVPDENGE
jgi:light-regulated signal transduction histidine kinase (bacteriophytochrome)